MSLGATAGSLGGLALLFGALLAVPEARGCSTSIPDGVYGAAMVPAHLAAAAIIAAGLFVLARERGLTRARRSGLGAAAAVAVVSLAWPLPFEWLTLLSMFASLVVGPLAALALGIRALLSARLPAADFWPQLAPGVEMLGWLALWIGVPAAYAWSYVNAASLFCF